MFQHLFESRILVEELLSSPQNMNRIVDSNSQNDRSDKHRKRIELSIEKRRKSKGRNASVKHRCGHKDRAFNTPEEERGQQKDQNETDAKRENTVVRHIVHFLQTFVSSFHSKTRRNRIFFAVKILKKRIGTGQDVGHKFVICRRLQKLCVHHTVKENLAVKVFRIRRADQAIFQMRWNRRFGIPFARTLFFGFGSVLFKESIKSAQRFIGKSEFLRNACIKPNSFLLFFRSDIAQKVHDKRAILTPDFLLHIFQIVAQGFQMVQRKVQKAIILKKLIFVIDLRRNVIAFPIFMNVIGNGILQSGDEFHIFALNRDHELVGTAESLVRFV